VSGAARQPGARAAAITLAFICALAMLNFIDRMALAAFLPVIKHEFLLTDARAAMLSASFALMYAACAVPLGRLADKYPRRAIISFTAVLWSVATAACALAGGRRLPLSRAIECLFGYSSPRRATRTVI
jgi:MFS transporter, Spinster family, sphingosine-1-phosphate transporter